MINLFSTVFAGEAVQIGQAFGSPWGQTKSLGDLFSGFTNLGIILAGLLILFLVIAAGWRIIGGTASGEADAVSKGSNIMTYAIIGFVVVFVSYVAIRVIETMLGYSFFTGL